ncbi:MAG TPA: hypothetical protein VN919_04300 [Xanthobacteraceae bacterium]|jgi:hypothetical protein|nr:hypothetical protein [Xanthobacteraceae bacterium]
MARNEYFLLLVLVVGLAAGSVLAEEQPFSSSLTPQQIMAKEKAVAEHAQKRAECRKQAKENKLGWLGRRKFVHECMAAQ